MKRASPAIVTGAMVAIVAAAAGMLLSRTLMPPGGDAPALATGTWLGEGRPLPELELLDQRGAPFTRASLTGHWSLLFFGFTSCPDICPTTLALLGNLDQALADVPATDRPQIVFVTVDPARDTPERVAAYVTYFSPAFTGVTGTREHIDDFTRAMSVPYAITQLGDGNYTVDHSSAIFLVDPQGSFRAIFSPPHTVEGLAADFRRVLAGA